MPTSPTAAARLNLLFDVLLNLARGNDEEKLLNEFASQLSWVLEFDRCWFALHKENTFVLRSSASNVSTDSITQTERDLLDEVSGGGATRRVEQSDPSETLLCLPLTVGDKTRGAVLLAVAGRESFGRDDVRFANAVTTFLALALDRLNRITALTKTNNELTKAKEALEQSNVELQQFAYIASHDLQTPLRSISGFTELLREEYAGKLDEQADGWIQRTVDGAQMMQTLIDDLLAYSRVDSKARAFEPVDFQEVFDDAIRLLEPSIHETNADVTCGELPSIVGDRSQLVQLLQNLIGNSIKYRGDDRPQIHVSGCKNESAWKFSVRDNGIGIDPKHRERVFEIFKRLHTSQKYPGTGIGLAVCRRVVSRHGGEIWVESNPGQGSTFYFTITTQEVGKESERK